MEAFITIPQKQVDRCVAFVRRALVMEGADCVLVYAAVRGHAEERIATIPIVDASDADDVGREVATAIEDHEDADRFRLACECQGDERATLVVTSRRKASGKGASRDHLLNGDAKDTLVSAAIKGYQDLVRITNQTIEQRAMSDRHIIERLTSRNAELEEHALAVARQHVDLMRQDREETAKARMVEVQVKALEDTAAQVQKAIPVLTAGVAKWAGIGTPGGGPPGAMADALRSLGAVQIVKLPGVIGEDKAAAVTRAWQYVMQGGGEGGQEILVAIKAALRELTAEQIVGLQAILDAKQRVAVATAYEDAIKG